VANSAVNTQVVVYPVCVLLGVCPCEQMFQTYTGLTEKKTLSRETFKTSTSTSVVGGGLHRLTVAIDPDRWKLVTYKSSSQLKNRREIAHL
jgi:hypothetical protein